MGWVIIIKDTHLIELSESKTSNSLVASGCHFTESTSKLAFSRNSFSSKLVVLFGGGRDNEEWMAEDK